MRAASPVRQDVAEPHSRFRFSNTNLGKRKFKGKQVKYAKSIIIGPNSWRKNGAPQMLTEVSRESAKHLDHSKARKTLYKSQMDSN